ncbi:MAG: OmpA family protein [Pseudomonadota bacterium]|nr:OmpA family protein [Pseudomonadota bacterium]
MTFDPKWMAIALGIALYTLAPQVGVAQTAAKTGATEPSDQAADQDAASLKVYFASGSARVQADQAATLDIAARTFRDGNPLVMIVSGGADTVGDPGENLDLSLRRAASVAEGLVARGIPVTRLQVLGRGNSELRIPTEPGVPEEGNRIVEISWR